MKGGNNVESGYAVCRGQKGRGELPIRKIVAKGNGKGQGGG